MAAMVEASRLLIYRAGSIPEGEPDLTPGLMAGVFDCEAALQVTSKALQAFGTHGYTRDFPRVVVDIACDHNGLFSPARVATRVSATERFVIWRGSALRKC